MSVLHILLTFVKASIDRLSHRYRCCASDHRRALHQPCHCFGIIDDEVIDVVIVNDVGDLLLPSSVTGNNLLSDLGLLLLLGLLSYFSGTSWRLGSSNLGFVVDRIMNTTDVVIELD